MILRARTILPVSRPPIENGALAISGNRILAVGPWPDFARCAKKSSISAKSFCCPASSTPIAISITPTWPGNCRRRKLSPTGLPLITAAKTAWSYSEYARSWLRRRAHASAHRHHHRRRHRGHAGFAAGSLGRHAAAGFFLSRNDRHQRAAATPKEILRRGRGKIDSLAHPR